MLGTIGTLRVTWFRNNAHTVHLMHSVAFKDYMYNNVHVLAVSKGQTRFGNSLGGIKKMIIFCCCWIHVALGLALKALGYTYTQPPCPLGKLCSPLVFGNKLMYLLWDFCKQYI